MLAPETDEAEGYLLAERLRAEVRTTFARETEKMTISCGVASFPVHGITSGELLHAADRAEAGVAVGTNGSADVVPGHERRLPGPAAELVAHASGDAELRIRVESGE